MKTLTVLCLSLISLAGCHSDRCQDCSNIWTDSSQRIIIAKTGGLIPQSQTYDYVRDALPASAEDKLEAMRTVRAGTECWNDAFTYELTIVDGNGLEQKYFSDNSDCDGSVRSYVKTGEVEMLLGLF